MIDTTRIISYKGEQVMIKRIIAKLKFHINYRKVYKELNKLSSRELKDIGLSRSMLTRISIEHARKITR